MSKAADKRYSARLYSDVAMATPAVRMVAVQVWIEDDGSADCVVYPVLALIHRNVHRYRAFEPLSWGSTHAEMTRLGWTRIAIEPTIDVVFWEPQFGFVSLEEMLDLGGVNSSWSEDPIICSWPSDQDKERLAPTIERLYGELRHRIKSRAKQEDQ